MRDGSFLCKWANIIPLTAALNGVGFNVLHSLLSSALFFHFSGSSSEKCWLMSGHDEA